MCLEIVGIPLEDVLRLKHRVADASSLGIKLGQAGRQVLGPRVSLNGSPIFLNGFVGQIAATIYRYLFLVHMSQGVVVIGSCLVHFAHGR